MKRKFEDNYIIPNNSNKKIKLLETLEDLISYIENYNIGPNKHKLNKILPSLIKLQKLTGMTSVKNTIVGHILYFLMNFEKNKDMIHTVIEGPPGVGKTTLGHIIGEIYTNLDIIEQPKNIKKTNQLKFRIVKRSDLIAKYLGQTSHKTQEVINSVLGGVLFIDEAYSLGNNDCDDSYSKECLDTLNQNLSENKNQFLCIIAGYKDALERNFFAYNEGLRRRFPFTYSIEDYTSSELKHIFLGMLDDSNWGLKEYKEKKDIIENKIDLNILDSVATKNINSRIVKLTKDYVAHDKNNRIVKINKDKYFKDKDSEYVVKDKNKDSEYVVKNKYSKDKDPDYVVKDSVVKDSVVKDSKDPDSVVKDKNSKDKDSKDKDYLVKDKDYVVKDSKDKDYLVKDKDSVVKDSVVKDSVVKDSVVKDSKDPDYVVKDPDYVVKDPVVKDKDYVVKDKDSKDSVVKDPDYVVKDSKDKDLVVKDSVVKDSKDKDYVVKDSVVKDTDLVVKDKDQLLLFFESNKEFFPNFGGDIEALLFQSKIEHCKRVFFKNKDEHKILTLEDINNGLKVLKKNKKINKMDTTKQLSMYL